MLTRNRMLGPVFRLFFLYFLLCCILAENGYVIDFSFLIHMLSFVDDFCFIFMLFHFICAMLRFLWY